MGIPQIGPIPFESIRNVASGFVVGVRNDENVLELQALDPNNLRQQWLRRRNPDGTFKIICRATGKVVDAANGISKGAELQQYFDKSQRNDPNDNQRWTLQTVDDTDPNSPFYILADTSPQAWTSWTNDVPDPANPGGRITLPATDASPGDTMGLFPVTDSADPGDYGQTWRFRNADQVPEAFEIVSRSPQSVDDEGNSLVLDVLAFERDPGYVQLYKVNGGFNQFWSFVETPDQFFWIQSACSRQVIELPQQAVQQRVSAQVILSDKDDTRLNQKWDIRPTGDHVNDNPVVVIVSAALDQFVLDSLGGPQTTGAQARPDNGGLNQQWVLVPWS